MSDLYHIRVRDHLSGPLAPGIVLSK
jgi:hypothetical protein